MPSASTAVLADPLALRLYARDASMVEGSAGLVVFVRSTDDVVTCMRVAARHDLPVVPRGSGTGLAGGATPIGDALVVVTSKMNRILEVRPEDRLAWVEPGVFNLDLGNALRPTGFTYAPGSLVAAGQLDRREREHERRRSALPRLRRDLGARPRPRRRAARRQPSRASDPRRPPLPATTSAGTSSVRREPSAS